MGKKDSSGIQDIFLALTMLAGEMIGAGLCIVTVLLQKELLPGWLEEMYMLLGGIVWLGLMPVYFCLRSPGKDKVSVKIRRYWPDALKLELWLLAVFLLWKLVDRIWLSVWQSRFQNDILYVAVFFLLILAAVLAAGFLVLRLLKLCGLKVRTEGPGGAVLTVCTLYSVLVILIAAVFFWNKILRMFEASVVAVLASHVFIACCGYGAVRVFMAVVCKAEDPVDGDTGSEARTVKERDVADADAGDMANETGGPAAKGKKDSGRTLGKAIGIGIPFALSAVLFILGQIGDPSENTAERAVSAVEEAIQKGYARLEEGDMAGARRSFSIAEARAQALDALVNEKSSWSLSSIYREYSDDVIISVLYLSSSNAMKTLGDNVRTFRRGMEWYPALLRYYGEQEELTEQEELLRGEILLQCIGRKQYRESSCLFAQDLEDSRLAIQKNLQDYGEELAMCRLFGLMNQYETEGGYTEEMAYEALEMAEAYPYNMLLQYIACQIAGNFQEDGARHYGRTLEAAERFDRLYDDGTRTNAQTAHEKLYLGDIAAHCYSYEAALAYYEEAYELSGETAVALSCAEIYERLGNYERCAEMTGEVLGKEPDNTQALYLMAVSSLKIKDVDRALEAAGRLGDLVADKDRPTDSAEENSLYICAQYMGMRDSGIWTDYGWMIYPSLSEEQIAAAKSHELFWNYMSAVYQCFMQEDFEAATESVEKILEVRDDLAMGWYLRGTIAFSEKDFRKALNCFEKAVDCGGVAPAIYFSMANAYDAMGDYENAWIYCKKVEEMLPYQDHGKDVYGISIHNRNLLNAVGEKIGK